MPQLLDGLNSAQIEAVTHDTGPLLIIAGPGSGKTRVLSRRFAHLVADRGVDPERILALTFNNKAADEMRERTELLIGGSFEELWISTFHSFCMRLLREQTSVSDLEPFFEPVTEADRLALLLDNLESLSLRHTETYGNPADVLAKLIGRIDRCKDELVSAGDYRLWAKSLVKEAVTDEERIKSAQEIEFADVFAKHDSMLKDAGAVDFGDLIVQSINLLRGNPHLRGQVNERHEYVLVDEFQDTNYAQAKLLELLVGEQRNVTVVGDDDQSIYRFRGASQKNILDFQKTFPDARVVRLERNYRSPQRILDAAYAVVSANEHRLEKAIVAETGAQGSVECWRCRSERAQAQAVAQRVEHMLAESNLDPNEICILVKSVKNEGGEIATALTERGIPYHIHGAAAFFERSEIRDILAWLRILLDPWDHPAVVRALARPPIELRPVDQARISQIARRRKIDLVRASESALDGAELPAASRDQIRSFLALHGTLARAFEDLSPQDFVGRLLSIAKLKKQQLFAVHNEAVERLLNIAKFQELALKYARRRPRAGAREFARHMVAVSDAGLREEEAVASVLPPSVKIMTMHSAKGLEFDNVFVLGLTQSRVPGRRPKREVVPDALLKERLPEDSKVAHQEEMRRLLYVAMTRARKQLVLAWPEQSRQRTAQKLSSFMQAIKERLDLEERQVEEELFGPKEGLYATFQKLRDELLQTMARAGGKLTEMRLDTYMDVNHSVVQYLELLKVAALLERTKEQPIDQAIAELNELLLQAMNHEQRKTFLSSKLDRLLSSEDRADHHRRALLDSTLEPSLDQFIPRRGEGIMLSATDIETYRTCPLKYKYARVYSIPQEQTVQQRFGILMHRVLERYHSSAGQAVESRNGNGGLKHLMELFETAWRRSGLGATNDERQLHEKAVAALHVYQRSFEKEPGRPIWFERNFSFHVGPHQLRGRVDRVDVLPSGEHELIDYKTGRPKSKSELTDDVQLSVYQIGAKQAWKMDASAQSYYYLLDNKKVPVKHSQEQLQRVREIAEQVACGIRQQEFEPTPSYHACRWCSFQMICPAAEK